MTESKPGEIFFECTPIGNSVRVVAIDADTGTEVTFQAPLGLSQADTQRMAMNKLAYVLRKRAK